MNWPYRVSFVSTIYGFTKVAFKILKLSLYLFVFINFRKIQGYFVKIKSIKKSNKLVIFADKTNNLYKVSAKNYDKLL